jgi:hypothetical protein
MYELNEKYGPKIMIKNTSKPKCAKKKSLGIKNKILKTL